MSKRLVVPVIRGVVGNWVFYSGLMTPEQIARWIKPAKDIREADSLDEILQRDLDDRAKKIAKYLSSREDRFFNSIIVGVFNGIPDWVPFNLANKLKELGADFGEGADDIAGMLIFDGDEQMFAIDGQHRVAGIAQLVARGDCPGVMTDQFSVIFIAHVDDPDGQRRTRRLFSDINKNAKPVARGDRVLIDEDDECAVVARRLYAQYPHFQGGELISLTRNSNLEADDYEHFTNLLSLHTMVKLLKKLVTKPRDTSWLDENNLGQLTEASRTFLDFVVETIPDYKNYFLGPGCDLRKARRNNHNLLFRPVGFLLLCRLYVHAQLNRTPEMLEMLKRRLSRLSFLCPDGPFERVLWNKGKLEVTSKNQKVAVQLALYILGFDIDKEELLNDYREVTKNDDAELPPRVQHTRRRSSNNG